MRPSRRSRRSGQGYCRTTALPGGWVRRSSVVATWSPASGRSSGATSVRRSAASTCWVSCTAAALSTDGRPRRPSSAQPYEQWRPGWPSSKSSAADTVGVRSRRYVALLLGSTDTGDPNGAGDPRRWGRWESQPELGTAWVDEELQRLRVDVFIAAMALHEQLARRAGEAMNDLLRLWLALQSGDIDPQHAAPVTVPAWQAFFLLIPLASTTFASMRRLLAHAPAGSLGVADHSTRPGRLPLVRRSAAWLDFAGRSSSATRCSWNRS